MRQRANVAAGFPSKLAALAPQSVVGVPFMKGTATTNGGAVGGTRGAGAADRYWAR
jgi:hypothetical protein